MASFGIWNSNAMFYDSLVAALSQNGYGSQRPEPFFERARSGRAGCRCCMQKIEKDFVRLGVQKPYQQHYTTVWYHATCVQVKKSRACAWCGRKPYEHCLYMPDTSGTSAKDRAFCFTCYFRKVTAQMTTPEKSQYFCRFESILQRD